MTNVPCNCITIASLCDLELDSSQPTDDLKTPAIAVKRELTANDVKAADCLHFLFVKEEEFIWQSVSRIIDKFLTIKLRSKLN